MSEIDCRRDIGWIRKGFCVNDRLCFGGLLFHLDFVSSSSRGCGNGCGKTCSDELIF